MGLSFSVPVGHTVNPKLALNTCRLSTWLLLDAHACRCRPACRTSTKSSRRTAAATSPSMVTCRRWVSEQQLALRAQLSESCVVQWADQGVLLLNNALTVRAHTANSHKGKGWEGLHQRSRAMLCFTLAAC